MLELFLRVVGSLLVVVGLLWVIARTGSRRFGGPARGLVRVVARQPLARTASLAVVEVGERVLVVGVSENGVSLLTEMDPSELPAPEVAAPTDGVAGEGPSTAPARSLLPVRPVAPGLTGSVLSAQTWRQAWAAATSRQGGSGD